MSSADGGEDGGGAGRCASAELAANRLNTAIVPATTILHILKLESPLAQLVAACGSFKQSGWGDLLSIALSWRNYRYPDAAYLLLRYSLGVLRKRVALKTTMSWQVTTNGARATEALKRFDCDGIANEEGRSGDPLFYPPRSRNRPSDVVSRDNRRMEDTGFWPRLLIPLVGKSQFQLRNARCKLHARLVPRERIERELGEKPGLPPQL